MEACVWQGVCHGVGVSGHLLGGSDLRCWQPFGMWGEPMLASPYKQGIGVAVIILHVSFRANDTTTTLLAITE